MPSNSPYYTSPVNDCCKTETKPHPINVAMDVCHRNLESLEKTIGNLKTRLSPITVEHPCEDPKEPKCLESSSELVKGINNIGVKIAQLEDLVQYIISCLEI
jgi:hypothetical protein